MKKILIVLITLALSFSAFACGGNTTPDKESSNNSTSSEQNSSQDSSDNGGNGEAVMPEGDVVMKVGVMSDSQLEATAGPGANNYTAPTIFKQALTYYKNIGVKALFFMGDMVDNGLDRNYILYNQILDEVFPDKETRPEIIYNMGNHERYTGDPNIPNNRPWSEAQFRKYSGQDLMYSTEINGYSFITIPSDVYDSNQSFTNPSLNFLEAEVKKATAKANGKPVFVGMHEPIVNTVYGDGFSAQSQDVYEILKPYPNVVLFTAHSHFPIADERSIHQCDFTTINTGSSSYCCLGVTHNDGHKTEIWNSYDQKLENVYTNGSMMPKKNEYSGIDGNDQSLGLVVEIYNNVTTVERRNFELNKRVGEMWYVPSNTKVSDFIYTDTRYDDVEQLPVWDKDHNATAIFNGVSKIEVTWDDAHWGSSPVETYEIQLIDPNAQVKDIKCYVSDYFAGRGESKYRQYVDSYKYNGYKVKIIPYDCFHHKGKELVLDVKRKGQK